MPVLQRLTERIQAVALKLRELVEEQDTLMSERLIRSLETTDRRGLMRTAIYARISDDKEGAGLGVKRQEDDCRELVGDRATAITVYADNDRSAYSGKPRPAYQQMLADARAGQIDTIVAWHTDRLHRSPRELEEFIDLVEAAGIRVETARSGMLDLSTPAGRMVARQLGAVARYESEHKSERHKRKAREVAHNGQPAGGGTRPFGFEADRVTLRPDEAAIIRELAERLLAGETLRALCVDLAARGIMGPRGKPWTPTPLRRMLRSGRISGQREHHGEIVATATWPAIITPEQTTQIRALVDDPSRRAARPARSYLLSGGIVRCSHCGAPLIARPRDDGERRYVCATGPRFIGCGKSYVLAEPLEGLVSEAVLWAVDTPELAVALREENGDTAPEAQNRVDHITARLDELAAAYASGDITMREWLTAREPLQQQLDAAKRDVARDSRAGVLNGYVGHGGALRKAWPDLTLDRKRAIIGAVLQQVVVNPGRRGYNRFDPNRFDLVWRYA